MPVAADSSGGRRGRVAPSVYRQTEAKRRTWERFAARGAGRRTRAVSILNCVVFAQRSF